MIGAALWIIGVVICVWLILLAIGIVMYALYYVVQAIGWVVGAPLVGILWLVVRGIPMGFKALLRRAIVAYKWFKPRFDAFCDGRRYGEKIE
jgi:hypothetical protein